MMKKKWLAAAVLAGVMALALTGCGGGGNAGPAKPKRDWQPAATIKYGSQTADLYDIKADVSAADSKVIQNTNAVLDGDTVYIVANGHMKEGVNRPFYVVSAKLSKGALTEPKIVTGAIRDRQQLFTLVGHDLYYVAGKNDGNKPGYYDGKEAHITKLAKGDLSRLSPTGNGNEVFLIDSGFLDRVRAYKATLENGELKDKTQLFEAQYKGSDGKKMYIRTIPDLYGADKDSVYIVMMNETTRDKSTEAKMVQFDKTGKEVRSYPGYGLKTTVAAITDNYVVMGAPADYGAGLKVYSKKDGKELGEVKLDFAPAAMHKTGTDSLILTAKAPEKVYLLDL